MLLCLPITSQEITRMVGMFSDNYLFEPVQEIVDRVY